MKSSCTGGRPPTGGLYQLAAVLGFSFTLAAAPGGLAGDILRGGAGAGTARNGAPAGVGSAPTASTALSRANARDALSRTTQALQSVKAMQDAARNVALTGPNNLLNPKQPAVILPTVPNGLGKGGLLVAPGVPLNLSKPVAGESKSLWRGAELPTQNVSNGRTTVTITQTKQQAILNWRTFNVGKETTLKFDQSAGGANQSEWIAFNKINDPSGRPSQILGAIEAPGQVYLINQNGILFGGSSQINLHTLVASSLPINDNLLDRGLLNNPDVQFLFSSLEIPVLGTGGTMPAFLPTPANTADGRPGDVMVQAGATLTSPTTADHVGGRIALIGPNVENAGTISTPDGQTILAAGLQVGLVAHPTTDPSLRGLDVYIGQVDRQSGSVINSGLIDAPRANVTLAGKNVEQRGVIESSTSVALNGRIDLLANYNTVQSTKTTGENFLAVSAAGTVTLGAGSVTRILPELASDETVVGTQLPLSSQINLQGLAIHLENSAQIFAPNATVTLSAGSWQPVSGSFAFTFDQGQIYLDAGAAINVAGTTDVEVPVTQNIVEAQLRGPELADSPLQRLGLLRGSTIQIDLRNEGTYNGVSWIGTPLANVAGYVGLIERSVGQLTVGGGTVSLTAGNSVVLQNGASIDVSGGWINYAGGLVQTTRVLSGGQLLDISQATPDRVYDGIYTGTFTVNHAKWGITEEFTNPLALTGAHYEADYTQGANGGTIAITAPAMALDGTLRGQTVSGEQQRSKPAGGSTLALTFQSQDPTPRPGLFFPIYSPTPPEIVFQTEPVALPAVDAFVLDERNRPQALREERLSQVVLSSQLIGSDGFGTLKIENSDGNIVVPADVTLAGPAGGTITLAGANIDIQGQLSAPGGSLAFSVFNYSPADLLVLNAVQGALTPKPDNTRGLFTLGSAASLSTAGLIVDDRRSALNPLSLPLVTVGGSITIQSYSADLAVGGRIDASGGVAVSATGKRTYGNAGSISIRAGQDPNITSLLGGELTLGSSLMAFSGSKGGALSIFAPLIRVGPATSESGVLNFAPEFFNQGGFSSFSLSGLAGLTDEPGSYRPGLVIESGTILAPVAQNLLAVTGPNGQLGWEKIVLDAGLRAPVSLSFSAVGVIDTFSRLLVARGDLVMSAGSGIFTDPLASVSLSGDTAAVLGSIYAPGGTIKISGGKSFASLTLSGPLPTVDLGPQSVLSVAGTTLLTADPRGYRTGAVLPGGSISVSGNIVAEAGARLDVSGSQAVLDYLPGFSSALDDASGKSLLAGSFQGSQLVPTAVASNAGSITLQGSEVLFSAATLLGAAGGPGALGGSLSISSGRFTPPGVNTVSTPLDVTLFVTQSDSGLPAAYYPAGQTAIGYPVPDENGDPRAGLGYFAADYAAGFDAVNLHGTVQFSGDVTFQAGRSLTVADGGVILADPTVKNSSLTLVAPYVAIGAPFQTPLTADQEVSAFEDSEEQPFFFAPTYGTGRLNVSADLIDVGNLSLQKIGQAGLFADQGDVRGNGTLNLAGELTIRAGQVYPTTAETFTITAYDYQAGGATRPGSVAILLGSGPERALPLSAGGELNIYAANIFQGGVLRAPIGTINLGWDGTGTAPTNLITGTTALLPIANQLALASGSVTSVSAVDPATGEGLIIPYGLNLNGTSWIDPTGTDITAQGTPAKLINISALNIADQAGSTIDLRGGGDLYAYRFVKGLGGSTDLLSSNASFAVIPSYQADFAPYAPYSTSPLTENLGTDPGYINPSLKVGDRVYLGASSGLPAGTYTLLPARYALLAGAFLVTPQSGAPVGSAALADGSSLVAGYRFNGINAAPGGMTLNSRFEVAPAAVVRARAEYEDYSANAYFAETALARETVVPRLPIDSGQLILQATQSLSIQGTVTAQAPEGGRGGIVDISSPVDILIGGSGVTARDGTLALDATVLSAFGAESLLIGGIREFGPDGTTVRVNTGELTVDNAGSPLSGPDLILVANDRLTLAPGAEIASSGTLSGAVDRLLLGATEQPGSGNGLLLRVSADADASVQRSGVDQSTTPQMTIGAGARLSGTSLILDSTSGTNLDPSAVLLGQAVSLNSGQISLILNNPGALPATAGLVLSGGALQTLLGSARSISLLSYSSIDIYGTGQVGALDASGQPILEELALHAAQLRGIQNGGGLVGFNAQEILLDNSAGVTGLALGDGGLAGTLAFNAGTIRLGGNQLDVTQFAGLELNASSVFLLEGSGGLSTQGGLTIRTPLITGATAASQTIRAAGALDLQRSAGLAPAGSAEALGARLVLEGASLSANTDILLPSGQLTLHATSGDLLIGNTGSARLDVSGTAHSFYDFVQYTGGGEIILKADAGSVGVFGNSVLSVAAQSGAGDAGQLVVTAPEGEVTLAGTLLGHGGNGGSDGNGGLAGTFSLDVGQLGSTGGLNSLLNAAGFTASRTIRVRTGDVLVDGLATAQFFSLSADQGAIQVIGTIDASGLEGGTIYLGAAGSLTLSPGANLTVAAQDFDAAGKGGAVTLAAGSAIGGVFDSAALLAIQSGATIDLSVASDQGAASAALGRFTGTLHLRAPQTADQSDLQINPIAGTIRNASSLVLEGYQIYDLTGTEGSIDGQKDLVLSNGQIFGGNSAAIVSRLLVNNAPLSAIAHVRPGAEIINLSGNLKLSEDWDLSTFRFGPNNEPGVLTLRAAGNLIFKGSLSDGFETGLFDPNTGGILSLAKSPLMAAGSQSWTYHLTAGADLSAADYHQVQALSTLGEVGGSLRLGRNGGINISIPFGPDAVTESALAGHYQVIRTGTGDIDISAARDVRLLNPFATIYTAGTQVADPTMGGAFDLPQLFSDVDGVFTLYPAQYSLGGGNVSVVAGGDILHLTRDNTGKLIADSQRQMPTNWLYRRGYVDPTTGEFGVAKFGDIASTSWWVDFSNFFQGVGALGGGNVTLIAGRDISNVDAVIPTNARMPKGEPDANQLVELGGGDLVVRAGNDLDGGVYYVERGQGTLSAGNSIHTNSTRSPSPTNITNEAPLTPETWLPTTLFLGKGGFDVSARGDLLLGPVANPFLLPGGVDNTIWYKTYFSTYAPEDNVKVSSLAGSVTLRTNTSLTTAGIGSAGPILQAWYEKQLLLTSGGDTAAFYQPWLRLNETSVAPFTTVAGLLPPALQATAFSGDINLVGGLTLSPSPQGTLDLAAAGAINGLQSNGVTFTPSGEVLTTWGSSRINLSDANPAAISGVASPYAYQVIAGTVPTQVAETTGAILNFIDGLFNETGSTQGIAGVLQTKQALHAPGLLHADDLNPVHIYSEEGDISGFTLFAGKAVRILAGRDLSDVALYLQNVREDDISVVSAGRDILAYNANSFLLVAAQAPGNALSFGSGPQAGDIQIGGPGTLEVLAGRELNLGIGPRIGDGTALGITSIGDARNPYLPFEGASIIAGAGLGGPAALANGALDFASFIDRFLTTGSPDAARYLTALQTNSGLTSDEFLALSAEAQASLALETFYLVLRDAGRDHGLEGSPGFGNYAAGFAAIEALFPGDQWQGDISLTSRQIKTQSGGDISLFAPGGQLTVGFDIAGAQSSEQGILTEDGGNISIFTHESVIVGTSRIFTLRGGNEILWSTTGDIAAGASSKTVQSAPPTRVLIDPQSGDVKTDLAGLATGGGIGVLATVEGVPPGDVDLIAPGGTIDAGDAGIRVSGNLNISAVTVLNASNIQAAGTSVGTPTTAVSAPNLAGLTAASNTAGAASSTAENAAKQARTQATQAEELPSIITVEVLGYGGGEG